MNRSERLRAVAGTLRDAHAQRPHGFFTAASFLWLIFVGMHTTESALVHPVTASVLAMSSGRLGAIVAGAVGLIGIVIGGRALARSAGRARSAGGVGNGGAGGGVAIVLGLIGVVLGGLVVATSDGGVGTGNGLGGAVVAMVLGTIGIVLGGLARVRTRRSASAPPT